MSQEVVRNVNFCQFYLPVVNSQFSRTQETQARFFIRALLIQLVFSKVDLGERHAVATGP